MNIFKYYYIFNQYRLWAPKQPLSREVTEKILKLTQKLKRNNICCIE